MLIQKRKRLLLILSVFNFFLSGGLFAEALPYTIVDTGQVRCYGNTIEIEYPQNSEAFFGQDAQYSGNQPVYKNNGDGTITDLNTGFNVDTRPQGQDDSVAGCGRSVSV